ncbi:unnamed protein product [Paramecium sonneborni]|uniref:Uncharacterized protein n=1 Tax=Paramecium sonneborni TaxID=65129 RepID=A0A8S1RWF5_9CILI|nr:unnamed protein product [Paramecium sonneborni]
MRKFFHQERNRLTLITMIILKIRQTDSLIPNTRCQVLPSGEKQIQFTTTMTLELYDLLFLILNFYDLILSFILQMKKIFKKQQISKNFWIT